MSKMKAHYPDLKNTPVLITGGASGIGAAMVRAFAAQGAFVGFLDFDRENGEGLADELGDGVHFEYCDLRDIAALRASVEHIRDRFGPLRVLINNAARDDRHNWRDVTPEYWDERQATNLRHMFFAIQAVAPGMIDAGGGSIINFGSCSWFMPMGGFPAYATSKAAAHGLTRTMASELGPHRIRVNTIVPGAVMTERQKSLWHDEESITETRKLQCLKDLVEPDDIAQMALFLAADASQMCTAQNFFVDGGIV